MRSRQKRATLPQKPRSKYGATQTTVDGITFDSAKEARRYVELKALLKIGEIRGLRWQPRYALFALTVDGPDLRDCNAGVIAQRRQLVCDYVADFEYQELKYTSAVDAEWRTVVEDVKSPATRRKEVYRLKRKLFEAQYGISIRET